MLTACDTGNLDYSNNVASQLAISQNVDQVIAPDGLGSLLSIGIVSSTYTKEKSDYYGRNGEGFTLFQKISGKLIITPNITCLLYTSPSPRDGATSRMPSSA